MKKIISIVAALCMLMSMTTFAATYTAAGKLSTTDAQIYIKTTDELGNPITTVAPGGKVVYNLIVEKDTDANILLYGVTAKLKFADMTKIAGVTANESDLISGIWDVNMNLEYNTLDSGADTIYITVSSGSPATVLEKLQAKTGPITIGKFTATVADEATGEISLVKSRLQYNICVGTDTGNKKRLDSYTSKPELPTVTIESGSSAPTYAFDTTANAGYTYAVINDGAAFTVTDNTTGIKPIGKVAAVKVEGIATAYTMTEAAAGITFASLTGAADSDNNGTIDISVELVDVDASIATLQDVFKEADGSYIVFGKSFGTLGADYGIQLSGLVGENAANYESDGGVQVDATSGTAKFPATSASTAGVFGVQFGAFAEGASAAAYVGNEIAADAITIQ